MKAFWWLGVHPGWLSFIIAQLDILKSCPSIAQKMPKTRMANKFKRQNTHIKITELDTIVWALEEKHHTNFMMGTSLEIRIEKSTHLADALLQASNIHPTFVAAAKENSFVGSVNRFTMSYFFDKCLKNKETKSLSVSWASCNQTLHCWIHIFGSKSKTTRLCQGCWIERRKQQHSIAFANNSEILPTCQRYPGSEWPIVWRKETWLREGTLPEE